MSSILNALKKVEAESAAAERVQIRSGKLKLRQGTKSRSHRPIGWAILILGVLLLTGGAWLILQPSKTPLKPQVQSYRIASVQNHLPTAKQHRKDTPKEITAAQPAGHLPHTQQQASVRHTVKIPPAPAQKHAAAHPSKPRKPPTPRSRPTQRRPPAASTEILHPQAVYKVSGHGLTLQAIAWDPNPQKRFAVVNSQIVREGQGVNGKMIRQIQRDAIIVRQGSENWKIVFR